MSKAKEAPKFVPTHRYIGGDRLVYFPIGEMMIRAGDSAFDGCSTYENEAGERQQILDIAVEAL